MKGMKSFWAALVVTGVVLSTVSWAADETRTFQIKNRLRVEYDDNIYEEGSNPTDSYKIIEELELLANLNFEQSYIGLRYRPTYEWWDDRASDSSDWQHDVDIVVAHNFTPRLSLSVKDTLRIGEQPEAIDRGTVKRENGDFMYNVVDGNLSYLLRPGTRLEAGGRYTILRYDEQDVADIEDYDIAAGGLTLRHELTPNSIVRGEYRIEEIQYDREDLIGDRGSLSQFGGVGLEQVFSPNLLADGRVGYQYKEYNDSDLGADGGSDDAPYLEASVTFLPSPQTRITAGASYSMFESDIEPFSSQDRTVAFISTAYDITARVSLYLAGSYQLGEYNEDTKTVEKTFKDGNTEGDEEVLQFSARLSYKVNRDNWLEANAHFTDVTSDLREDYDRTRLSLGWRTQLF